jgi:hypothetical protein
MNMKMLKAAVAALVLSVSGLANAGIITSSFVKNDTQASAHTGTAVDSSTGKYYQRDNYSNGLIHVYSSKSDFENNIKEATVSTSTRGTYFEVINGKIYSRTDNSSNLVSIFDATTGALLQTTQLSSFSGSNGVDGGFGWGGYSSMNFMEDNGNLYVFGGSSSINEFIIQEVDLGLNVLATYNTGLSKNIGAGFASIINGSLFLGSAYYLGLFDYQFNLSNSQLTSVNFDFNVDGYLTNTNYVSSTDTLYISNLNGDSTYMVANASSQLLVPTDVSEPSALAIFALGIMGLASRRFKKQ